MHSFYYLSLHHGHQFHSQCFKRCNLRRKIRSTKACLRFGLKNLLQFTWTCSARCRFAEAVCLALCLKRCSSQRKIRSGKACLRFGLKNSLQFTWICFARRHFVETVLNLLCLKCCNLHAFVLRVVVSLRRFEFDILKVL